MKKIVLATGAAFSLLFETAFAVGESLTAQISQIELIDYIIISGLVVFVLGLLMIMLSFVLKGKKRADKFDEDGFDELEAYEDEYEGEELSDDDDDDGILDDEDFDDDSENCEEETEEELADDTEEPLDEAVEEETDETETTENVEEVEEEAEFNEDDEETEPEEKVVAAEEPEEVKQKARISFTGQNNSVMKFIEFEDSATVGRRKNNDFVISDGAVSGNHCRLSLVDGKVYIEDMNSTNGTFIGGEKITREELNSGDILAVGQMSFKVNIDIID